MAEMFNRYFEANNVGLAFDVHESAPPSSRGISSLIGGLIFSPAASISGIDGGLRTDGISLMVGGGSRGKSGDVKVQGKEGDMDTQRTSPVTEMRRMVNALHSLYVIRFGVEMGFFKILSEDKSVPASLNGLVEKTGYPSQYVMSWLRAVQSIGIIDIDAENLVTFKGEWGAVLTDEKSSNFIANLPDCHLAIADMYRHFPRLFRDGAKFAPEDFGKELIRAMSSDSIRFANLFMDGLLDKLPGLRDILNSGATVYDVGCGGGIMDIRLADAFPKSQFVGIDILPRAIEVAGELAKEMGAGDNLTFKPMDATKLPSGVADCIILNEVLHEIEPSQRLAALTAIRKALKPGGILFVVDALAPEIPADFTRPEFVPAALCDFFEAPWGSKMATRAEFKDLLFRAGFGEPEFMDFADELFVAYVVE